MLSDEDYINFGKYWSIELSKMLWDFLHDEKANHTIRSPLKPSSEWKGLLSVVGNEENWVLQCDFTEKPKNEDTKKTGDKFVTWQVSHEVLLKELMRFLPHPIFHWDGNDEDPSISIIREILLFISLEIESGGIFYTKKKEGFIDEKIYEDSPKFRTS